jgi:hypothetical protein
MGVDRWAPALGHERMQLKYCFICSPSELGGLRDIWSPRHAKYKIPEWAAFLYKKAIPINSELLVKSKKYLFLTQVSHPVECIWPGECTVHILK